ncbi:hypothetical protein [Streptomyces sp. NPDC001348]
MGRVQQRLEAGDVRVDRGQQLRGTTGEQRLEYGEQFAGARQVGVGGGQFGAAALVGVAGQPAAT